MKPLQALVLILALSETLLARPILPQPDIEHRPSFPWKKYLRTIGAIGIIGSLFALVFLGTKHDEAYNAIDSLDRLKNDPKVVALSEEQREYLLNGRIQHIGREMDLIDMKREEIEGNDFLLGFPVSTDMPDTTGMRKSAVKKLVSVHKKAAKAEEKLKEAKKRVDEAKREEAHTRIAACEIIATDWNPAVKQAEEQVRSQGENSAS